MTKLGKKILHDALEAYYERLIQDDNGEVMNDPNWKELIQTTRRLLDEAKKGCAQ